VEKQNRKQLDSWDC